MRHGRGLKFTRIQVVDGNDLTGACGMVKAMKMSMENLVCPL